MEKLVYIYDGSFDGLLCCVFSAYSRKERPDQVATEEGLQLSFGQQSRRIITEYPKANRVAVGFEKKAGKAAMEKVEAVFLSHHSDKASLAFRYFVLGFHYGRKVLSMLAHPDVLPVNEIANFVAGEVHALQGFVRFTLLENNVYYAKINPKSNLLPLLMPHFVDRFSDQSFIIHDEEHKLAGLYNQVQWQLVETEELALPSAASGEERWQALWKLFYESIEIKQRRNTKLKKSHCPMRYWNNMLEMQPTIPTPAKKEIPTLERKKADATALLQGK